jgi:hypothetical protein
MGFKIISLHCRQLKETYEKEIHGDRDSFLDYSGLDVSTHLHWANREGCAGINCNAVYGVCLAHYKQRDKSAGCRLYYRPGWSHRRVCEFRVYNRRDRL